MKLLLNEIKFVLILIYYFNFCFCSFKNNLNYKNLLFPNRSKINQNIKKESFKKESFFSFLEGNEGNKRSKGIEIEGIEIEGREGREGERRSLLPDINNPPDGVDSAICVICRGLEYCPALNGLLIQEVYYPESNAKLGTCHIIDQLGERMYNEIFGIGRTFRDTPQCRTIVMQYLCLFWGTENDMYTNLCFWKEDTSNPDPTLHEATGRPPCRSFCVQVFLLLLFCL